jgi:hypothetical protein
MIETMKYYVLIYDQSAGRLLDIENYGAEAGQAALARRFELDRDYHDQGNVEVVLLSAESEDALRRTHSRYFKSVDELVKAS